VSLVALVLTAGLGTRLRPLSHIRAKPAMPLDGVPVVLRILRWLAGLGIEEAILNLHHRPETITRVVGNGDGIGLRVRYSWEDPILGSAGGPRRAFGLIDADDLLVVNGDTLTDPDVPSLIEAHRTSRALATLAVTDQPPGARYGGVRANEDGSYAGTAERGAGWHYVGVQMVRREAFDSVRDGESASTIGGVYEELGRRRPGSVRLFPGRASFLDIGTPETYLAACLTVGGDVTIGARGRVASSAQLSRCVMWDDVVIEDAVGLSECIVGDRVVVPRGSRYHRAVLVRARDVPPDAQDRLEGDLLVAPLGGRAG
jgi:NDP-sugar pyrophosphorylase family protein